MSGIGSESFDPENSKQPKWLSSSNCIHLEMLDSRTQLNECPASRDCGTSTKIALYTRDGIMFQCLFGRYTFLLDHTLARIHSQCLRVRQSNLNVSSKHYLYYLRTDLRPGDVVVHGQSPRQLSECHVVVLLPQRGELSTRDTRLEALV